MIRSMTGYGKAECLLPDKKLTIEIKSLNSKQMDTNTRLPSLYKEKELEIRQLISAELERGKVECSFYYELSEDAASGTINEAVVKSYYDQLYRISGELGLNASLELLSTVMRMPDTIRTEKAELEDKEWTSVKETLVKALGHVNGFRSQEGEALDVDLRLRVESISDKLNRIEQYEEERIRQIRERIGNNLLAYLKRDDVDENRSLFSTSKSWISLKRKYGSPIIANTSLKPWEIKDRLGKNWDLFLRKWDVKSIPLDPKPTMLKSSDWW